MRSASSSNFGVPKGVGCTSGQGREHAQGGACDAEHVSQGEADEDGDGDEMEGRVD